MWASGVSDLRNGVSGRGFDFRTLAIVRGGNNEGYQCASCGARRPESLPRARFSSRCLV